MLEAIYINYPAGVEFLVQSHRGSSFFLKNDCLGSSNMLDAYIYMIVMYYVHILAAMHTFVHTRTVGVT